METGEKLNALTEAIIGAAMAVHSELGPGLLESAYERCLGIELEERGLRVERQKILPLTYRGIELEFGYRLDLLVDEKVVVEVKTVEALAPIHGTQLLSYLRLSGCHVGLLLNFNVASLRDGIQRVVNDFPGPEYSSASSAPSAFRAVASPKEDS